MRFHPWEICWKSLLLPLQWQEEEPEIAQYPFIMWHKELPIVTCFYIVPYLRLELVGSNVWNNMCNRDEKNWFGQRHCHKRKKKNSCSVRSQPNERIRHVIWFQEEEKNWTLATMLSHAYISVLTGFNVKCYILHLLANQSWSIPCEKNKRWKHMYWRI